MLVSIALTAVCTARACTKRLDETQWPETRDETYWAETETYCSETETRPRRDVSTSRDRLETETTSLLFSRNAAGIVVENVFVRF